MRCPDPPRSSGAPGTDPPQTERGWTARRQGPNAWPAPPRARLAPNEQQQAGQPRRRRPRLTQKTHSEKMGSMAELDDLPAGSHRGRDRASRG
eukprot:2398580-Pyramimonas_sp.AAC.1